MDLKNKEIVMELIKNRVVDLIEDIKKLSPGYMKEVVTNTLRTNLRCYLSMTGRRLEMLDDDIYENLKNMDIAY